MSNEMDNDMWDREDLYKQQVEELEQEESDLYEEEESDETEVLFESDFDDDDFDGLFDDSAADESLIGEARARLEQARLYDLLLEHDLFDGVDAIPQVVTRVQQEIKSFIEERYLVLSGMKQEKSTEVHVVQDSKFNDMEVQALKMIAAKVTKGASVEAPTSQPQIESELNTVKKQVKPKKINPLGVKKKKAPVLQKAQTPVKRSPEKPKKKSTPQRPARRVKQDVVDKSTANKSVVDLAKKDIKYIESLKKMSLEEAAEVVKQRHPNRISKNAPDQKQVNAHYQLGMSMNQTASTFATLLANAKSKE